ncbi:MAG: HAD-IIA family hydrolase [Chloroflexota bacterium]|nr:HAD-IIA family hydrolase [Chloroflexota bacterium]
MRRYDGFVLDLDGTVYLGDRLIPGADRAVARLRAANRQVVFLSNKPLESRDAYAAKLTRLGIPTPPEDVITSSLVLARVLARETPGASVVAIAEPPLIAELERAGIVVTDRPERARWVVISFDRTFDYRKLDLAFRAARHGAELIATNPDRTCPVDGGELPDCAAMIGAVEGCAGRRVERIVGKPSPLTAAAALERLELPGAACLIVGDRPETDIRMGLAAGMDTALVLTGVTRADGIPATDDRPTYVLASIAELERFT